MGNTESSSAGSDRGRRKSKRSSKKGSNESEDVAARAKQVVGESVQHLQANISSQIKQLEEQDHPAAHFLDTVCGAYMDERDERGRVRSSSFYSEEYVSDDDDDRTYSDGETTTTTDYNRDKRGRGRDRRRGDDPSVGADTASYLESDYESQDRRGGGRNGNSKRSSSKKNGSASFESDDSYSRNGGASEKSAAASTVLTEDVRKPPVAAAGGSGSLPKPLASSFAKRCYFTKAGIGSSTQHYEGLTLTGNVVLMLAQAMKLKGCPTICDEDLRRVEQTYPNQFSRLPDELLLSSGWRRISKYCHFSNKPVPDGIPFFHSKQRLHPTGGYYFLLAAAVGMVRPIDVEPLTRDTLVLLETDYPGACDAAPNVLVEDPDQWTLVDKFCFFSGGPINTDEDVYYQADFDGNPIYMLAFLSPSLTPTELYKLEPNPDGSDEPGLKSVMQVQEVESVYDLTERDFDDLRLYHLGPCRALPQYILQPTAWAKVLPPHFLEARETALLRAEEYEIATHGAVGIHAMGSNTSPTNQMHSLGVGAVPQDGGYPHQPGMDPNMMGPSMMDPNMMHQQQMMMHAHHQVPYGPDGMPLQYGPDGMPLQMQMSPQEMMMHQQHPMHDMQMMHQYGPPPEDQMLPMDEAAETPQRTRQNGTDPPEDEPPSLRKRGEGGDEVYYDGQNMVSHDSVDHHNGFAYDGQYEQGYPGEDAGYEQQPNSSIDHHHEQQHQYHEDPALQHQMQPMEHGYPMQYQEDHHSGDPGMHMQQEPGHHYPYHQEHDPNLQYQDDGQYQDGQGPQYYDQGEEDAYREAMQEGMVGGREEYQEEEGAQYAHEGQYYDESKEDHYQQDGNGPASPQEQSLKFEYSADPTEEHASTSGPISPPSVAQTKSEISHTSSAMRGARELLKKNRQKRLEIAARRNQDQDQQIETSPSDAASPKELPSPQSEVSGGTWESGSEVTSVVSATSSAWTENSDAPNRSSRRALILQMAKARMKNNKVDGPMAKDYTNPELMGTYSITEEEKKLDGPMEEDQATDIDIAGDLD